MINTREIAMEYRLSHWAKVMQDSRESGMSKKEFCQSIGIHEHVYYYWQRKLREAACQEMEKETDKLPVPNGWAVCKTSESANANKVLPIEINGCRILAGADVDPQLLTKVCRLLVSL